MQLDVKKTLFLTLKQTAHMIYRIIKNKHYYFFYFMNLLHSKFLNAWTYNINKKNKILFMKIMFQLIFVKTKFILNVELLKFPSS
jgi:hypothetical protein